MPDVEVRSWSDRVHAAYVDLGESYPTFVGTAATRPAALRLGRKVQREFGESPLAPTVSERVSTDRNGLAGGELGCARRERVNAQDRRTTRTPAVTGA